MAIKELVDDRIENVAIDITDTGLALGVEQENDLASDWQARACPPPAGKYRLKLSIDKGDFEQGTKQGFGKDDPNGKYYKATVTCKIQDPTGVWQDTVLQYNASSGIMKGKPCSTMAGLLVMIGDKKLPSKIADLTLTQRFFAIISKNLPVLIAEVDWSAWDRSDKSQGDFGSPFRTGMKNFPKLEKPTKEGIQYNHIVKNKKGDELVAKGKIIKWLGKATASAPAPPPPPPPVMQVVKPESATQQVVMGDDDEVMLED